jgi:hypothetical protein
VAEEDARRAVAEGRGERLVDARLQRAALDAQAHLDLAVAPDLVHPDHLVDAASLGNVAAAHQLPRPVAAVIVQLDLLAVAPQSVAGGGVERSSLGVGRRRVGGVGAHSRVDGG